MLSFLAELVGDLLFEPLCEGAGCVCRAMHRELVSPWKRDTKPLRVVPHDSDDKEDV